MANRPKPTRIKLLQGNPGKRRINHKEPQPKLEKPIKPEGLGEYGEEIWDELVEELYQMGVMTTADRRALELLARAYDEYRVACNKTGKNYSFSRVSDCWKRCKGMLCEFGLSPSSRSKIEILPNQSLDPLEEFLAKGKRIS